MMDCREARTHLARYLRGGLPAETAEAVRRHTRECASCRTFLLTLQKYISRIGEVSPPARPSSRRSFLFGGDLQPWERWAPLYAAGLAVVILIVLTLRLTSCSAVPGRGAVPVPAPVLSPTPTPVSTPEDRPVRLRQSQSGSVLVLEEEGAAPAPAGDYDPFQDHLVTLRVRDVAAGLPQALDLALAAGAQAISYPVKGFENLGPNERVLVFDIRTYRPFLEKLGSLGRVEYAPLARSDYVTVRLTVVAESTDGPAAPAGGKAD
jgi:hypothetical protein